METQQYRSQFEKTLDELEQAAMAQAVGRALIILSRLDPNSLQYLLESQDHEKIVKLIVDASATPETRYDYRYGSKAETARLALEHMASERKEAREKADRDSLKSKFMSQLYRLELTARRKNKLFFTLDVEGDDQIKGWIDFGSKTSLNDWKNEALRTNHDGTKTGLISRSEILNMASWPLDHVLFSENLLEWARQEPK